MFVMAGREGSRECCFVDMMQCMAIIICKCPTYQVHIVSLETHRVGREDIDEYFIMKLHKDVAY